MIYLDFCQQLRSGQAGMPQPEAVLESRKIKFYGSLKFKQNIQSKSDQAIGNKENL